MDFIDICRIKLPSEYNRELDKFLSETKSMPMELINRFNDAYNYGNSTPMQWLVNKLQILRNRVDTGETILTEVGIDLDKVGFLEWVKKLYPDICEDVFAK